MAITQTQILQLTMAMFKATPGAVVNADLLAAAAAGMSITDMANALATKSAFNEVYPTSMTNAAFAYVFINDLVGSNVAQADKDWAIAQVTTKLAAGQSRAEVIWWAAESLAAVPTTDATWGAAAQQFANKVEVSNYYTVTRAQGTGTSTLAELQAPTASVTADAASVTAAKNVIDRVGSTYTLTTSGGTISSTTSNDTFDGSVADSLGSGYTILDPSATDNDTLNATITKAFVTAPTIANVENINIDWNAFGTATVDASKIAGSTITVSSSKLGYLGNVTFSDAASNKVVAGSGAVGTLTVTTGKDVVVDGGQATQINVTVTSSANVTAGANTTNVTVAGASSTTVDAGTATTVSVTDKNGTGDGDTATVKLGASASVTNAVDVLTLDIASGKTATVDAIETSLTVTGAGDVTVKSGALDGERITNSKTSGALTVQSTATGAQDVSKISADLITFSAAVNNTVTAKTGANLKFTLDQTALVVTAAAATAATNTVTATFTKDQATSTSFTSIKTVNLVAAATQATAPTVTDITFADLSAGTNNIVLTGTNDVKVTAGTAAKFTATALNGELDYTQKTDVATELYGATGKNTVVFKGTNVANSFTGQDADDNVTFVTTTGSAVAVLGNGANTVTANSAIQGAGTLAIYGGAGVDTVSATGITTGTIAAETGAGNDSFTFGTSLTTGVINLNLGDGDDTVTFGAIAAGNAGTITIDFGEGSADTLKLANTATLADDTVTFTGLEIIQLTSAGTATLAANDLSGKAYTFKGTGAVTSGKFTDTITAKGTVAAGETIDLSGITLAATLSDGIGGATIVGNAGADTIIGTTGNDVISTGGGNDTVTGGKGADSMTGGAGNDTFVIASGDAGKTAATIDSIIAFKTAGTDKLKLGTAGSVTNYTEVDLASGGASNVADALTAANTAMDGTIMFALIEDSTSTGAGDWDGTVDSILFIDFNLDGTADAAVKLVGKLGADIVFGDIIA